MENNYKITLETEVGSSKNINPETSISNLIDEMKSIDSMLKNPKFLVDIKGENVNVTRFKEEKVEEKKVHPYFNEHPQTEISEKQFIDYDKLGKTLLFTPHFDDEIIGAAILLREAFSKSVDIKVVYLTSGDIETNKRVKEDQKGIEIIGGSREKNMLLKSLPFYARKDRQVTEEDEKYLYELIKEENPQTVFICADMFDPHRTHERCYNLLMKTLENSEFSSIKKFFYYSIWYLPKENEYTHIVPYKIDAYISKVNSILAHESQFETNFMGEDSRPFYYRAVIRDNEYGKVNKCEFCELYFELK